MDDDYLIYLNTQPVAPPIGRCFAQIYLNHLDNQLAGDLTELCCIDLIFLDDDLHCTYLLEDVIDTCERWLGWRVMLYLLTASYPRLQDCVRKLMHDRLAYGSFTERIIEEARKDVWSGW